MTTNEKLTALRAAMAQEGMDAYYIPSSDPHMSEYLPEHWKSRAWLSGFSGSAGTLVVTALESALWTDGRYFIQAARELLGSEIQLMKMAQPGVPTAAEYLKAKLPMQGVLGIDGDVTSLASVQELTECCAAKHITIKNVDLITNLWQDRPEIPATTVYSHAVEHTGASASEKLEMLRDAYAAAGASACLVCRLDSAVWLLNIRASDIQFNPFALCYVFVTNKQATLFINQARVSQEAQEELAACGVDLQDYGALEQFLKQYALQETLLVNSASTNYTLACAAQENPNFTILEKEDPIQLLKGVKSAAEIAGLKNSHAKDGVAMVRFQIELENAMQNGKTITELDVEHLLRGLRLAQPLCIGESFHTIAAYGANAAMMHYSASEQCHAVLQPKGFLLVDSGAQYLDGTTDITRTYALGSLTQDEKRYYTLVLKSHIQMAMAVFLEGCTGGNLDILARTPMWKAGLDYRCGTGHGVGYLGGVHEGPQNLRITNQVKFVPGMTITNEPGYYEEGVVGIRIENEMVCIEKQTTEYGTFLAFEPFTYCPIDTTPLLLSLMSDEEIAWLNDYHALVLQTLSPLLTKAECSWLQEKTAPVTRT